MEGISVTCPNCSAVLNVEKELDFCFCTYCGTKVFIPKLQEDGDKDINITVDMGDDKRIENYMIRGWQLIDDREYEKAEVYFNRVLDIDATNEKAQDLLKKLQTIITRDNVVFKRDATNHATGLFANSSSQSGNYWILIDGEKIGQINPNCSQSYRIPVGEHTVQFKYFISKSPIYDIEIKDNKTVYEFDIYVDVGVIVADIKESRRNLQY